MESIKLDNFTITSFEKITGYKNGKLKLELNDIQSFSLTQDEYRNEQQTTKGYHTSIKSSKRVYGKGVNGCLNRGMFESLVGSEFKTDIHTVRFNEELIIDDDSKIQLTYSPTKILSFCYNGVYLNLNKCDGDVLPNSYFYNSDDNSIYFNEDDFRVGSFIRVYYDTNIESARVSNYVKKYSDTLDLYIDMTVQNTEDEIYIGQIRIPYADFDGTFVVSGDINSLRQSFEFTSLSYEDDGNELKYLDYTIFKQL